MSFLIKILQKYLNFGFENFCSYKCSKGHTATNYFRKFCSALNYQLIYCCLIEIKIQFRNLKY